MQKVTKEREKVVQGAYIPTEIHEILKKEAAKRGKRPSSLASIILTEWAQNIDLENARAMVEKANGAKQN